MGIIGTLHYAWRVVLLFFNHLKRIKPLKVQISTVCHQMIELRAVFAMSSEGRGEHHRTAIMRIQTPLALLPSIGLIRLFRRFTRRSTLPDPSIEQHCTDTICQRMNGEGHNAFMYIMIEDSRMGLILERTEKHLNTLVNLVEPTEIYENSIIADNYQANTFPKTCKRKGMGTGRAWIRTMRPLDLGQANLEDARNSGGERLATPQQRCRTTMDTPFDSPICPEFSPSPPYIGNELRRRSDVAISEFSGQSTSPNSDTTLCNDSTTVHAHHESGSSPRSNDILQRTTHSKPIGISVTKRYVRHHREVSAGSAFSSIMRSPSIPLCARAKTNEGMLRLRSSHMRDGPVPLIPPRVRHRRKISLNLPINTSLPHNDDTRQLTLNPRVVETPCRTLRKTSLMSESSIHREQELEYIHRRIFIGTASLDDFLELLDFTAEHTTTRHAIVKSFTLLASNEQIHTRQRSSRKGGWDLVGRFTSDDASIGLVAQRQIKLGSITLQHLLDLIPFDAKDEIGALHVVEAFLAASHIDGQAGVGTGSKAKAFRSWMVKTIEKDE